MNSAGEGPETAHDAADATVSAKGEGPRRGAFGRSVRAAWLFIHAVLLGVLSLLTVAFLFLWIASYVPHESLMPKLPATSEWTIDRREPGWMAYRLYCDDIAVVSTARGELRAEWKKPPPTEAAEWSIDWGSLAQVQLVPHVVPERGSRWICRAALPALLLVAGAYPLFWISRRTFSVLRKRRRERRGRCLSCGYSLTGNTSGICPECGTPNTPGSQV